MDAGDWSPYTLRGGLQARGPIDHPPAPGDILRSISVTLAEWLQASEVAGNPTSARFEVENGQSRISVHVVTDVGYAEAAISTDTGILMLAQKLTDLDDLQAARAGNQAA